MIQYKLQNFLLWSPRVLRRLASNSGGGGRAALVRRDESALAVPELLELAVAVSCSSASAPSSAPAASRSTLAAHLNGIRVRYCILINEKS